ncbi:MAG: diacylglycerol/lipid kinase family protein [Erysipelotrichaceae bacterium]
MIKYINKVGGNMHFVFIINPYAGAVNSEEKLLKQLEKDTSLDYSIYYTKYSGDATSYVKNLLENNDTMQQYCFVCCGGDGTINEVINGMAGQDNCCFSVYPCGSGNDYVKYFGGEQLFTDISKFKEGTIEEVDIMEVNGRYCANVVNLGFETQVVKFMHKVKRIPVIGGKHSYTTGLVMALCTALVNKYEIVADGQLVNPEGKFLLCTLANGSYVGGAYKCAPLSQINDGLMELCMARCMNLIKLVSLINVYKEGKHIGNDKFKKYIEYRQVKEVSVQAEKPVTLCLDGEIIESKQATITNHQKMLKFYVPKQ